MEKFFEDQINISRNVKAVSHKFKCQFCPSGPVLSCPVYHVHHNHHDYPDHHDHGKHDDHGKLEVICMRKLEVVHKEVGGYLSMAQIDDHQSVSKELLWQLKTNSFSFH